MRYINISVLHNLLRLNIPSGHRLDLKRWECINMFKTFIKRKKRQPKRGARFPPNPKELCFHLVNMMKVNKMAFLELGRC